MAEPITEKLIEQLKQLEKAALQGPWEWNDDDSCFESTSSLTYVSEHGGLEREFADDESDRALILALRNNAETLIAAAEEVLILRTQLDQATKTLRKLRSLDPNGYLHIFGGYSAAVRKISTEGLADVKDEKK